MKKTFYISTALPYVNSAPHLGFTLEAIQADVVARYHRFLKKDVFFLMGTDEHGAKVAKAAKEAGKTPEEFTDEISEKFKALKGVLNLSNNDFIRTTDRKRHWPAVKKAWLKLKENNDIYLKKYEGLYCPGCEAFITKKNLVNGECAIHRIKPEIIEEENYFFKLSKYSQKIKKAIETDEVRITPESRKKEVLNFIKQGLEDISFSRPRKDLKWGIPVPDDEAQTIYVWADALVNYLSAIDYFDESEKFKKCWPADIHFIGKDILRFHAVFGRRCFFLLVWNCRKIYLFTDLLPSAARKCLKAWGMSLTLLNWLKNTEPTPSDIFYCEKFLRPKTAISL